MSARRVGAVAIGRNEGERLVRCLDALVAAGLPAVYVDSGSTDESREVAEERGVEVVELDLSKPFTAARARNAGAARLAECHPDVELVQFVDGDCELEPGWIETAVRALDTDAGVVVVCGRRRERFPDATPYNRLCDMEWDTPIGEAEACGGDALYRRAAFDAVGGFDETLIAGEEPELCHRLRLAGGRITRLDAPMTLHDADVHRFSQWWRRTLRSGFAAAEAWAKHGADGERHMVAIAKSALTSAVAVPLAGLAGFLALRAAGLPLASWLAPAAVLVLWARLVSRVRTHRIERGDPAEAAGLYARYTFLGKFAETLGIAKYAWGRLVGRRSRLIEYK